MKRFQNILMAVAVSALAVVSCAKEEVAPESNVQEDKVYEYLFTLGEADDTKATLEKGNVVTWQTGDYLGVVCKHGTSYSWANNNTKSAITPSTDDTPAVLNVTSHYALEGGDGVYCFFPYKDGSEFKTASITFSIPTEQSNSINEMPMASIPYTVSGTISADTPTPVGSIDMMMLGSIARFKIYSSVEEYRSETVQSVTLTTDQPIAGSFTKDISVIDPKTTSTLTISGYKEKGITETGITGSIGENSETAIIADVVVAPGTYTGKVIVRTDKASYEYSLGTGKTFERAHAKPLALNLGKEGARSEQKYFRKVTTDHDNFSGTYLVVYSDDKISKAFSGSDSGGNCIDVTIANDAIASTDALLNEALTIVKENDKYYLKNAAGKYLYMSTASVSSIGSSDDKKEVTVSYSSNIEVSSTNGSTGTLQCKTGTTPYIRFYTSSQNSVDFYVLDGTEIPNDPNIVSLAVSDVNVPSTTKNVEVEIHCNKDWKATATSDLLTDGGISIEGTSATTSFIVPFNKANTDVKNDKVVTVTVSAGEGKYYTEKTIKVTQNAPYAKLELESKAGSVTKDAGSTTFAVSDANFEWSVLGITVDDVASVSGYSANKTQGEGYLGSVTITYPENATDKPKKIIVTIGDQEIKTATYTLTQAAGQTASVLYELVTDVNNLTAGDEIMLGSKDYSAAAGSLYSTNKYFTKVGATFSNNTMTSEDAIVLTLKGDSTNGWSLWNGSTQIGWSSTDLATNTNLWTIEIESGGTAKIFEKESTNTYIQYNSNSGQERFKPYSSNQKAIQIYKKADNRPTCGTPTADVNAGTVDKGTHVALSSTTAGATIYYTIDGSTPSKTSSVYSSPIEINTTTIIKAIAIKEGCKDSGIFSATYTVVKCATPSIDIDDNGKVTLGTTTEGAEIRYTTNGDNPTSMSMLYDESNKPQLEDKQTIKAIAVKSGCIDSEVNSRTYNAGVTTCTITWSVNGKTSIITPSVLNLESAIEFPTPTASQMNSAGVGEKVFKGWIESSSYANESIQPSYVTSATAVGDKTYYAVFASKKTTTSWNKMTSVPADGDVVAICAETYAMKASISSNRFANGEIKINGNVLDGTVPADCQWTVGTSGTYLTLKNSTKYAAGTNSKNQGALVDSVTDLAKWTITYNNGFTVVNYGRSQATKDSNNKYLRNNTTNGWATYASSTGNAPIFFKKTTIETESNYQTNY